MQSFRDFKVIKQFSTLGSEADIYLVEKNNENFILKLYRYGITPKEDVTSKIIKLSNDFPEYFVKIFEAGFDNENRRNYEIQEYIENSSLKEFLDPFKNLKVIIEKIYEGLKILHENNILHLDIKPANILIRTIEPFSPVFTDFGISSILDPELTRKMTNIKGTPLYWAPESFTGVVGKEADYWSLGIIILEILQGFHPFSRMEQQVIMYTLSTRGVEIPQDIPGDYKLILRGLLTRNPKKRWGIEEVSKWLNGEKNIRVHYFDENIDKQDFQSPYEFQGEQFYSLKNLLGKFISAEESWKEAKVHLEKGYISKWLEKNEDFSKAVEADKINSEAKDPDLNLLRLIYKFNHKLPFVVLGKLITLQNLYLFCAKKIKREASEVEQKIVELLISNNLLKYYKEYLLLANLDVDDLFIFLDLLKKVNQLEENPNGNLEINLRKIEVPEKGKQIQVENIFKYLKIILEPEIYGIKNYAELNHLITFSFNYSDHILITKELLDIAATYVIPVDFIKALENTNLTKYGEALKNIRYLSVHNHLIEKMDLSKLYANYMLPDELKNNLNNGDTTLYILASGNFKRLTSDNLLITVDELNYILEKYILPDYVPENLRSNSLEKFLQTMTKLREIQDKNLLIEKNELKDLNSYILPDELKADLKRGTLDLYSETARNIRYLQEKKLLITLNEFDGISQKYIFPKPLKESLFIDDYQKYLEAIKNLRNMQEKELLIEKSNKAILSSEMLKKLLGSDVGEYIQTSLYLKNRKEDLLFKRKKQLQNILLIGSLLFCLIFTVVVILY